MTEGIFALVGVLIGGLLTGGLEVWRDNRGRRDTLRAAGRAMRDEAGWGWAITQSIKNDGEWDSIEELRCDDVTGLRQHVEAIGKLGTYEEWHIARAAERALGVLQNYASKRGDIAGDERRLIDDLERSLNIAMHSLDHLAP